MAEIVIRLNPGALLNPDLDLRYEIPDQLARRSGGVIVDDGYGYEPGTAALHLYFRTTNLALALSEVFAVLEKEVLIGNQLGVGAEVGVCEGPAGQAREFSIVFPHGASGVILAVSQ